MAGFVFVNQLNLNNQTVTVGEVKNIRLHDGTIIRFRVDSIKRDTAYEID